MSFEAADRALLKAAAADAKAARAAAEQALTAARNGRGDIAKLSTTLDGVSTRLTTIAGALAKTATATGLSSVATRITTAITTLARTVDGGKL